MAAIASKPAVVEIPEEYIYNGRDAATLDPSLPKIDVPTIDFGLLTSPETQLRSQELEKLSTALTSWGCFRLINHGIEPAFLDQVREVGKQFFDLPLEKKKKHSREHNGLEGYSHHFVTYEVKEFKWIDRLFLASRPENQRQLKYWPQDPPSFRETVDEFNEKIEKIDESLLIAAAKTLNLEENSFLKAYGGKQAHMNVAYNLYPSCPRPDLAVGIQAHGDATTFTYLLQYNDVEGLQLLKDNQWYRVANITDAIFVNVGDQLEIMSNGIFKSLIHRVITDSQKERMSVALFCFPGPDQEIGPVDGVVSETRPRMYKTLKDYMSMIYEFSTKNEFTIEVAKI